MAAPFEIIGAPYAIWVAPVGEAMPDLDAAPAGNWELLGTSGVLNYDDDGVTVDLDQKFEEFRGQSTVPRKVWRVEEDMAISVKLVDLSIEQCAKVLNDAAITTIAAGVGVAGEKNISLYKGVEVATFAVLARGISPEDEQFTAQFEMDSAFQEGTPSIQLSKGKPAMLDTKFRALDAAGTGDDRRLRVQTAAAT